MTTYASIKTQGAYLNSDFGLKLALRKFNITEEDLETLVGRYVKGKRKGQLRGKISWQKVKSGGWVSLGPRSDGGYANGFVALPNRSFGYRIVDAWTDEVFDINKGKMNECYYRDLCYNPLWINQEYNEIEVGNRSWKSKQAS